MVAFVKTDQESEEISYLTISEENNSSVVNPLAMYIFSPSLAEVIALRPIERLLKSLNWISWAIKKFIKLKK